MNRLTIRFPRIKPLRMDRNPTFYDSLGLAIKVRRTALRLYQADLAPMVGDTASRVSERECGHQRMDVERLVWFCKALDTTPNELLAFAFQDDQATKAAA